MVRISRRVLFVYRNVMGIPYIDFGIASLSAYLRARSHEVGLVDFTFGLSNRKAVRMAKRFRPDLICFSARSNEFEHVVETAAMMKDEIRVPVICGGPHPTIAPEDALRECFDGICVGEGEIPLLDLVSSMDSGKDYSKTRNFWFRKGGKVIRNPLGPLVQDLDGLPLYDYDLFDMKRYIKARDGQMDYMSARGCPFRCSYCINHVLQNLYRDKGKYVRLKSVGKIIQDLKELKGRYPIKTVFFIDEIFNISTSRLREFSEEYSREIGLPFECCVRANLCSDENMGYLRKAGCTKINIAIESGDEKLRHELLNKHITDEQIVGAFRLAKKHGIHTMSYNMIGLPMETPWQIEKTIDINSRAGADSIQVSTYIPFFGTSLFEYCRENDLLLGGRMDISYYLGQYLRNPNLTAKQLERYRRLFSYKCYRQRSWMKAYMLLMRDLAIPHYLRYGKYIPVSVKRMMYHLFWHTRLLKFISK